MGSRLRGLGGSGRGGRMAVGGGVPPQGSKGVRGLNVAYGENEGRGFTVYVLWHEA